LAKLNGNAAGKQVTLHVSNADTIASVKKQILREALIPVQRQRLYFFGKELEDDVKLCDCVIATGSTLYLVEQNGA
jgi:hypothetical protein